MKAKHTLSPHTSRTKLFTALRIVGIAVGVPCFLVFSFISAVTIVSAGKVTTHTRVGSLDVGGMTLNQAKGAFVNRVNAIYDGGIALSFQDKKFPLDTVLTDPANSELSYPLVTYDIQKTLDKLAAHEAGLSPWQRAATFAFGDTVLPAMEIDQTHLTEALASKLSQFETPAHNAVPVIDDAGNVTLAQEAAGSVFDYNDLVTRLGVQLIRLDSPTLTPQLQVDFPDVTLAQAQDFIPQVQRVIEGMPYTLQYKDRSFQIPKDTGQSFLVFYRQTAESSSGDQVAIGFDINKLGSFLETIATQINVEAHSGKFQMKDGKVTEFEASQPGLTLNIPESVQRINAALAIGQEDPVDLSVDETPPDVAMSDVNTLGIKELVAVGKTSFAGSPKNRKFNINLAATKLNGILIAPGEDFSLVKALSPIDSAHGYLPELVIKGNKTTPEVGGGLCQVGTTFFRLVLNAGLPVLERRNHSYRVSYYEPPVGMDATIYDPKPDFRFTNDYASSLLLQTRIEGNELIFEFYGTKDGRTANTTQPKVFNVVKPGPAKTIETTDLAPGQRKCIEHAHNGSDAEFAYTVQYADGSTKKQTFTSHYKPWQEVCMVGVAKAPAPTTTQPDTTQDTNAIH